MDAREAFRRRRHVRSGASSRPRAKGTDRNAASEPVRPTPYLAHLLGVASLALEAGADEEEAIAALLHDALEDRPRRGNTARDILASSTRFATLALPAGS
jgi:predicted HD phosphohydrolase